MQAAVEVVGGFFVTVLGVALFADGVSRSSSSSSPSTPWLFNTTSLAEAIQSGADFVVIGYAPWCIACKRFMPVVQKAVDRLGAERIVKYNAYEPQPDAPASMRQVRVYPTLVRYRGGRVVDTHEGSMDLPSLMRFTTS